MRALPPGYLSKKGRKWKPIRLIDVAILLYHVCRGAQHEEVGFEDAMESIDSITCKLNKTAFIDPSILESALWSCNLMKEQGQWWHPKGRSFEDWVNDLVKPDKFHRIYNTVEKKGD